ncbi:MAG: curlin repeat-containing protein [Bacteroidales bacterium]|nr:curlin repeat-containing protein [Bacteroidales bacterium]
MKKIAILITAIFTVGFLGAQNVATTTTTGNQNDSKIVQTGDLQDAAVEQLGNHNDVDIDQYTDNMGVNSSDVYQEGDRNESKVDMVQDDPDNSSNSTDLDQVGDYNKATQFIDGHGDAATGYQLQVIAMSLLKKLVMPVVVITQCLLRHRNMAIGTNHIRSQMVLRLKERFIKMVITMKPLKSLMEDPWVCILHLEQVKF